MRQASLALSLLILTGCGAASPPATKPSVLVDTDDVKNVPDDEAVRHRPRAMPLQDVGTLVAHAGISPLQALPFLPAADVKPDDLGTRRSGSDWPTLLGPTANSVS